MIYDQLDASCIITQEYSCVAGCVKSIFMFDCLDVLINRKQLCCQILKVAQVIGVSAGYCCRKLICNCADIGLLRHRACVDDL